MSDNVVRPVRINLFGGPGVGKSTLAAWLFSQLKTLGHKVELVTEQAKVYAFAQRIPTVWQQLDIFNRQIQEERKFLERGVSIVTDAPLAAQAIYMQEACWRCDYKDHKLGDALSSFVFKWGQLYEPWNVYVERAKKSIPYVREGRLQSEGMAETLDNRLLTYSHPLYHTVHDASDKQECAALLTKSNWFLNARPTSHASS